MNKWLGRIPAAEYHADKFCDVPTLSSHTAATIVNDCEQRAHHEHPRLGGAPHEFSKEQDEGTLVHAVLLGTVGPGQFVGVEANDWRTKAAQEARDGARADGKVALLMRQYERLVDACDRIRVGLLDRGIDFSKMMTEHAALWEARATSGEVVQCRSMFDAFDPMTGFVWDLKTANSAHPETFRRQADDYGYDIQAHAYPEAIVACMPDFAGRVQRRWIIVETKAPYIMTVQGPAGSMRELGRIKWQQAVDLWNHALKTNTWPGYADGEIEASEWAIAKACERGGNNAQL